MDIQDKYDELDNIVSTLDRLIDDIKDKGYIAELQEIKWSAQNELEEVEKQLEQENNEELKDRQREYIAMQGF